MKRQEMQEIVRDAQIASYGKSYEDLKGVAGVVRLDSGNIHVFWRPSIETKFCFGYDGYDDYKEAQEQARTAREKDGFIFYNLKKFRDFEELLSKEEVYEAPEDERDSKIRNIIGWNFASEYFPKEEQWRIHALTDNDRKKLKEENKRQEEAFRKRLESYWNRYGNSAIHSWTYNSWD